MNCTRFADSSRHVVSGGVRDTQHGSFQSLIFSSLHVGPRAVLMTNFLASSATPLAAGTIAR
jgi:hypothetical protein